MITPTHNLPLSSLKMKSYKFSVVWNKQTRPRDRDRDRDAEKPRDVASIAPVLKRVQR